METELLAQKLADWIKEKTLAAGGEGVVLGMSGGIDSSVLAVLCYRAFPQNTVGVIMPCHSNPDDKAHALALAGQFGITTNEVVLDDVYDNLLRVLPDYRTGQHKAQGNLKARLRMLTLYYIANQLKYLVVGSGNRDELAVGYFSKYGDGGVDIEPLGNLVKTRVRELARFLKVPRIIIDKPPSAGLWDGQTDEAEMGFTYAALDRYLLTGDAPEALKNKIEAMAAASQHKRAMPPVPQF